MKPTNLLLTVLLLATVSFAQPASPGISQVLAFFCNQNFTQCPNGFDPTLPPIQLSDGNLYVVTWWAGQGNPNAGGTVFRAAPSGQGFVIHTFQPVSLNGGFPNGEHPVLALTEGTDGNLYGVTEQGGTHNQGVMYKLARNGSFQVLYNFCSLSGCPDGPGPLTLANNGNFYGGEFHTIYRLTPTGTWSLVYALDPSTEGVAGALIQASDGNFYGAGWLNDMGTIFRVTPAGQFAILYQFQLGEGVSSNLLQASDGYIYGGTGLSGPGTGIFRMGLSGNIEFIHQMTDGEGYSPIQLLQASDGNLWGLSDFRDGSFFAITLGGASLTSGAFNCNTTGCQPQGMIEGRDGNFYGTAISGGNMPGKNPEGTVFKIAAGLGRKLEGSAGQ
jgi:uncharacterized repeat protein (TIGR03803 family)